MNRTFVKELPDWTKYLQKDSVVTTKDLMALYGIKSHSTVLERVRIGTLPEPKRFRDDIKPDKVCLRGGLTTGHRWQWRWGDLLPYLIRELEAVTE